MEGKLGCVAHSSFSLTNSSSWSPRATRELVCHKVVQGSLTSLLPVEPETTLALCLCRCLCAHFQLFDKQLSVLELFSDLEMHFLLGLFSFGYV